MSNLVKKTEIDSLPLGLRSFAERRVGNPPFKSYRISEQKGFCLDVITKLHAAYGERGNDAEILFFQSNELLNALSDKYGELTLNEIEKALEMLISGEAGQVFGLNKRSYYQALKYYFELPQRTESMKEYLRMLEDNKSTELSPDEKLRRNKEACVWAFNQYKETKEIPLGHYKFYQTLLDLGLIKWTKEEKTAISAPIKKQYQTEVESSRKRGKISSSQLADIMLSLDSNPTLISRVRKEALKKYFNNLITSKTDLKNLLCL